MSDSQMNYEDIARERRDQFLRSEILKHVREANGFRLINILRIAAIDYKAGMNGIPEYANGQQEIKLRNIHPIDCDFLYDFLIAVAENIEDKMRKGAEQ